MGAPSGTLVTAFEQTAGRGRQGRSWSAPPGQALLCSLVLRESPQLLSLAVGLALADTTGQQEAQLKWPNDVLLDGRKVGGILIEGRPQEGWAVAGIGLNVAVRLEDLPAELRARAGTLGLGLDAVEPTLQSLLEALVQWLAASDEMVLAGCRARDALLGQAVRWDHGHGVGAGIDDRGRLLVRTADAVQALDAGEVHLV